VDHYKQPNISRNPQLRKLGGVCELGPVQEIVSLNPCVMLRQAAYSHAGISNDASGNVSQEFEVMDRHKSLRLKGQLLSARCLAATISSRGT